MHQTPSYVTTKQQPLNFLNEQDLTPLTNAAHRFNCKNLSRQNIFIALCLHNQMASVLPNKMTKHHFEFYLKKTDAKKCPSKKKLLLYKSW